MSELVDKLRPEFQDEEYRHSYAEECLNTMVATQIKVLREQRAMTQTALAEKADMRQPRLSVMEDAGYSSWSINTLKRLAKAFDLALSVKFEAFSDVILDFEELSPETLARPSFKDDPVFRSPKVRTFRRHRNRRTSDAEQNALQGRSGQLALAFQQGEVKLWPTTPSDKESAESKATQGDQNANCISAAS
jgi:predicted XRE-type DNA-binding protein